MAAHAGALVDGSLRMLPAVHPPDAVTMHQCFTYPAFADNQIADKLNVQCLVDGCPKPTVSGARGGGKSAESRLEAAKRAHVGTYHPLYLQRVDPGTFGLQCRERHRAHDSAARLSPARYRKKFAGAEPSQDLLALAQPGAEADVAAAVAPSWTAPPLREFDINVRDLPACVHDRSWSDIPKCFLDALCNAEGTTALRISELIDRPWSRSNGALRVETGGSSRSDSKSGGSEGREGTRKR